MGDIFAIAFVRFALLHQLRPRCVTSGAVFLLLGGALILLDGKPLMVDRKLYLQRVTTAGSNPSKANGNAQVFDAYHFVQPGETLYSISRKYGVSVEEVKAWNRLDTNQIEVGQRLRVRP